MSWLTELLFPRRTELQVRVQHYIERAEKAEEREKTAVYNERRMAKELEERDRLITILRTQLAASKPTEPTTVTYLREQLEAQKRVNNRLSNQLLDAVGHNAEELTPAARSALGLPSGGAR